MLVPLSPLYVYCKKVQYNENDFVNGKHYNIYNNNGNSRQQLAFQNVLL